MKFQRTVAAFCAASLVAMACVAVSAEDPKPDAAKDAGDRTRAGQLDSKLTGSATRVSQVIGMNAYNEEGKNVGTVKDIVIDAQSGKVRYAALSVGGFLGINDKMFAIPWTAFEVRPREGDPKEHLLVLNVTKAQLEKAPGFHEETWPNFGDAAYTKSLDDYYGTKNRATDRVDTSPRKRTTDREKNTDTDRKKTKVDE